jgi:hypothetical protein
MTHSINIEVNGTEPSDVLVGAQLALKMQVSCSDGCELAGVPVKTIGPDGVEREFLTGAGGTLDAALQAPPRAGEHIWRFIFGAHEVGRIRHEETTATARISIKPHLTSLAVWDIPSPVVTGEKFAIKVGAKSSVEAPLGGGRVGIYDETGTTLAQARLRPAPLPGTSALYWTELELRAPATPGMHSWSARFAPDDLALEHEAASYRFDVVVVPPAEHRLTVRVIERDSAAPIADAQLRLGPYWAVTDGSGSAEIAIPKGSYNLTVWKVGYEAPQTSVEVNADATVEVAVLPVPEENPDAAWTM